MERLSQQKNRQFQITYENFVESATETVENST